jgi:hypothetical protein
MLLALADGMASGAAGPGPLNNALLESFTIHTRVLLDFLYAEKLQTDDVVAEDFFSEPSLWLSVRPVKSDCLASVHKRVGKEIAHLTYARLDVTPEAKPWLYAPIANEVNAAFSVFLSLAPIQSLGDKCKDLKRQRGHGEAA